MSALHTHRIASGCSPDETCPAILDEPAEGTVILIGQFLPAAGLAVAPETVVVRLPRTLFGDEVADFLDAQRIDPDAPLDLTGAVDVPGAHLPDDELLQLARQMSPDETAIRIGRGQYEDLVQRLAAEALDGVLC